MGVDDFWTKERKQWFARLLIIPGAILMIYALDWSKEGDRDAALGALIIGLIMASIGVGSYVAEFARASEIQGAWTREFRCWIDEFADGPKLQATETESTNKAQLWVSRAVGNHFIHIGDPQTTWKTIKVLVLERGMLPRSEVCSGISESIVAALPNKMPFRDEFGKVRAIYEREVSRGETKGILLDLMTKTGQPEVRLSISSNEVAVITNYRR